MVLCAFGNCPEELEPKSPCKITITESYNGAVADRQSFCCAAHAFLWLAKRVDQDKLREAVAEDNKRFEVKQ